MSKSWLLACIIVGMAFGVANLSIALALGMTAGVGMLAAITLACISYIQKKINSQNSGLDHSDLACAVALASGMSFGSCSLLGTAVAAMVLAGSTPPLGKLVLWVMGVCGLGTCLAALFREHMLKHFPFPSGKTTASLIQQLHTGKDQVLFLLVGGLTTLHLILRDVIRVIPQVIGNSLPFQFVNAPILIGLGIILRLKIAASMFLGSLFFTYLGEFRTNESITTLAVSILLGATLFDCMALYKKSDKDPARPKLKKYLSMPLVISLLLLAFSSNDPSFGFLLLGVCLPLCVFFSLMAITATGQTDVVPVGPIGKIVLLGTSITGPDNGIARLSAAGAVSGSAAAGCDAMSDFKCGQLLNCSPKRQFRYQFAGALLGAAILTPLCIWLLEQERAQFLAPGAKIWLSVLHLESVLAEETTWIFGGFVAGIVMKSVSGFKVAKNLPNPTAMAIAAFLTQPICSSIFLGAILGKILSPEKQDLVGTTMMGLEGALTVLILYVSL